MRDAIVELGSDLVLVALFIGAAIRVLRSFLKG